MMSSREAGRTWAERVWNRTSAEGRVLPWSPPSFSMVRRVAAQMCDDADWREVDAAAAERWAELQQENRA